MKILLVTLSIFLLAQTINAQSQIVTASSDEALRSEVKKQAEPLREAMLTGNIEKIIELMPPVARRKIPDEKKSIEKAPAMFKKFADSGVTVISVDFNEPEKIVPVGSQLFAILPIKIRFQTPKGVLVQQTLDIAVSEDAGKIWQFAGVGVGLDNGNDSNKQFKKLFPAAAKKIKLPDVEAPVLEKTTN